TPPLFGDRRVVLARGCGRFSRKDDVAPLVQYLAEPVDTSVIVLVWELGPGQQRLGAVPKALTEALSAAGGPVHQADPGGSRGARDKWWSQVFADAEVVVDRDAQTL